MGTYAKPSQILDTRYSAFEKAYSSRRQEIQNFQQKQLLRDQKIFEKQAKDLEAKEKAQNKVYNAGISEVDEQMAIYNNADKFKMSYPVATYFNEAGEAVMITDDGRALLHRTFKVDDRGTQGISDDVMILDQDVYDNLSDKDKAYVDQVQTYTVKSFDPTADLGDKTKVGMAMEDVMFNDYMNDIVSTTGVSPMGIGIEGSVEQALKSNWDGMKKYANQRKDKLYDVGGTETSEYDLYNYYKKKNESILTNYPTVEGYFGAQKKQLDGTSDDGGNILNTDNELNPLNIDRALLIEDKPDFLMRANMAIDLLTGQNQFRNQATINGGRFNIYYQNPIIQDNALNINYADYKNSIDKKGVGLVGFVDKKYQDNFEKTLFADIQSLYANLPTLTTTNTYTTPGGKDVTEKEVVTVYGDTEKKVNQSIVDMVDGLSGQKGRQHIWQLTNGVYSGLGLTYKGTQDQKDYLIEYYKKEKEKYFANTDFNKRYQTIKETKSNISNTQAAKDLEYNKYSKDETIFRLPNANWNKDANNHGSFFEIASVFDVMKPADKANVLSLNARGGSQYVTGKELAKVRTGLAGQLDADAIYKVSNKQLTDDTTSIDAPVIQPDEIEDFQRFADLLLNDQGVRKEIKIRLINDSKGTTGDETEVTINENTGVSELYDILNNNKNQKA